MITCRIQSHTTGGSRRGGARRGGGAERGGTWSGAKQGGMGRVGSPRRQPSRLRKASKTAVLDDPSEARTNEILCKPNRGTQRVVGERFIRGTRSALRSWLLTSGRRLFVSANPFLARHVREMYLQ